jgi:hypothetical protein
MLEQTIEDQGHNSQLLMKQLTIKQENQELNKRMT